MNARILLLSSLIFSLIQGPFLPPVMFEGFLSVLQSLQFSKKTLFLLFITGIVFDLFQHKTLGVSSLIFLLSGLALAFPSITKRPVFLAGLSAAVDITRAKLVFGELFLGSAVFVFFLTFEFFRFIRREQDLKVVLNG